MVNAKCFDLIHQVQASYERYRSKSTALEYCS